jgi:hypothetical protein
MEAELEAELEEEMLHALEEEAAPKQSADGPQPQEAPTAPQEVSQMEG